MFNELLEMVLNANNEGEQEFVEALAAIEHEQWMEWAKGILESEKISTDRAEKWNKLFVPYNELSDDMKEEDRKWARKVLEICRSMNY